MVYQVARPRLDVENRAADCRQVPSLRSQVASIRVRESTARSILSRPIDGDAQFGSHALDQCSEFGHLTGQALLFGFQRFQFARRNRFIRRCARRGDLVQTHLAAHQMHPAAFAFAGRARQLHSKRRRARGEFVEECLDGRVIREAMQTRGVQPQFGGGLRASEQQYREQRRRLARDAEHAIHVVLIARDAAAACLHDKAQPLQAVDGGLDFGLGHAHHRRAGRLLIAAGGQGVQRKRVRIRDGVLLFDQHAKNTGFERSKVAQGWVHGAAASGEIG